MTELDLKLDEEADMETGLHDFEKKGYSTGVEEETGEEGTKVEGDPYFVPNTADYAVDVVGIIQEPTGDTLDGWHVNIRLMGDAMRDIVEALDTLYGVAPEVPKRVWL